MAQFSAGRRRASPSIPFRDLGWHPDAWLSVPAKRFRFVSITAWEDEVSRKIYRLKIIYIISNRQLPGAVRKGISVGGSFRAKRVRVPPSHSQGRSYRNSESFWGGEAQRRGVAGVDMT